MKKYFFLSLFMLLAGCSIVDDNSSDSDGSQVVVPTLYYGDIANDRVLLINKDSMELEETIVTGSIYPYEVTQSGDSIIVINRGDFRLDAIVDDTYSSSRELPFKPRSISNGLVTSVNEPAATHIDRASGVYSDSDYVRPTSYGGANATGHPTWVNESYFLLLDRTENSLELYEEGNYSPIDKVITKSSVHHIMKEGDYYYGIEEGVKNGVAPGVVKFTVSYGEIHIIQERVISEFSENVSGLSAATWGAHHGAIHPEGDYIYFGSREGNVFVLALDDLSLVDHFKAGLGVGHIAFYKDLLYTTNHYDNFKSFYNASNPHENKFIKNLKLSDAMYQTHTMQSHTTHIIDGFMYFMFNDERDATFFKVDVRESDDIKIVNTLRINDSYSLMGTTFTYEDEPIGGM